MSLTDRLLNPTPLQFLIVVAVAAALLFWRMRRAHFVALLLGCALPIAAAEGLCRWLDLGDPARATRKEDTFRGRYLPGGRLVYTYPDNPRGYFDYDNTITGRINAHGFRGRDVERLKPFGTRRVVFLGDSFTLGVGVREQDTLPAQFERIVRQSAPGVEALNFGVSGSSTPDQALLLETQAATFDPDLVLLVMFLNDTEREGTLAFTEYATVFRRLRRHSWFLHAAIGSVEKVVMHRRMIRHYHEGYEEGSRGWIKARQAIVRAKGFCDRQGIRFAVVLYPVLVGVAEDYPFRRIHETVARFCAEKDTPFLDLLPAFAGRRDQELWVHRVDQHPNEVAQGLAAAALAGFVTDRDLLRERP